MYWIVLGGLAAAVFGAAYWLSMPVGGANPDDPAQVSMGKTVYNENCASCHGANLEGQPNWRSRNSEGRLPAPPHDETGHTWHHPDNQLFKIVKSGVSAIVPGYESDMPAFESILTDEEIWASISYIESTWPPLVVKRREGIVSRMEQ